MIYSEKQFVNAIKRIEKECHFADEIDGLGRKYSTDIVWIPPTCMFELCEVLSVMFNDDTDTVSYFCFDIGFGSGYKDGDNLLNDEEWPLRTPEELYKYLMHVYELSKQDGDRQ